MQVRTVDVASTGMGPEAAARDARHAALEAAADDSGAGAILLGHTLDDQAEQVLLGLARGSGTRSLAGMRPARGRLLRPFLGLRRADTLEICEVEGLDPWHDPSNADPAFARSRTRVEVLPLLEEKLGPGVAESLARTAAILQLDADYLEDVAERHLRPAAGAVRRRRSASRRTRCASWPRPSGSGSSPRPRPPSEASSPATSACWPRKHCCAGRDRRVPWSSPAGSASTGCRSPQLLAEGQSGRRPVFPAKRARCGKLVFRPQKPPQI